MKIALIVPGGVDRSGRERVIPALLWQIERLARRHELHVIALNQYPEPCTYPLLGATVHNLGVGSFATKLLRGWRIVQQLGRFDVFHAIFGGSPGALACMLAKLQRAPAPSLVSFWGGELVALKHIGYGAQLHWQSRTLVRLCLKWATALTVATKHMQAQVVKHGRTVGSSLIPIGVSANYFATPTPPATNPLRLIHVASLNRVKDQPTLLRAMQRVVQAMPITRLHLHLDIVGEDILNGAIQQQSAALGLQNHITFHGCLPTDKIFVLLRQAYAFVLSSLSEGQCVAMCEAAAVGVPTVGTSVGLVADWAPDRAVAVPIGDDKALAEAIVQLAHQPALRNQLGLAAQVWATTHNADWTATAFENLYLHLLNQALKT